MTTVALPTTHHHPFDFRSRQFCDDALRLAHATGQSLDKCRQELFIAEGDVALACELLVSGYGSEPGAPTSH